MKTTNLIAALATATMMGAMISGSAMAQILGSAHDLSSNPGAGTAANGEICVYCHTPHAANTGAEAPLWNREVGNATYTPYASLTMDAAAAAVGSVSLACLSCHDGTQARDAVVNAPGSGLNPGGLALDTAGANGILLGTIGTMGAVTANLSEDLTNDHPISIAYAGGGIASGDLIGNDLDFNAPVTAQINSTDVFWVDTANAGIREKTDMILYGSVNPTVECGSCHDPHNSSSGIADESVAFLRVANTASAVCLACHDK